MESSSLLAAGHVMTATGQNGVHILSPQAMLMRRRSSSTSLLQHSSCHPWLSRRKRLQGLPYSMGTRRKICVPQQG
jgi:hypothetical protein